MKKNSTTTYIDPTAIVDKGAIIGSGTKVWHATHLTNTAKIGKNCSIGQNCYVAGKMGNGCRLQNNVNLYLGVEIKDFVFCGPSMTFTNDLTPRVEFPKHGNYSKTFVMKGASLGAHVTVVCGVTIGKYALVGAGTVVTKDVPDYALVYGNPGSVRGWVCKCGTKLSEEFIKTICDKCGRHYKQNKLKINEIT